MYVELGKLVGVWGVKGWVKLHSYTRNRADISQYKTWYLKAPRSTAEPTAIKVVSCREQGQGIVAQFDGVTDRDQAAMMTGQTILVKQADLPALPEGEFYWQELIGLTVKNDKTTIGQIDSILETGANDVLVCKNAQSSQADVLIPYIDSVVLEVDRKASVMIVDWDASYLID